jgi:hypothetical protein
MDRYVTLVSLLEASGLRHSLSSECVNAIFIFEIYPASPSPSFKHIASHVAQIETKTYEQYCLTSDKLVMIFDTGIFVWDFVVGMKATWALPEVPGDFKKRVSSYYTTKYVMLIILFPRHFLRFQP